MNFSLKAIMFYLEGRDYRWAKVERAHLEKHPACAACGRRTSLQVHHIHPFHLFPALELDPANLLTLCMGSYSCHLRLGHLGDWRAWNPWAVEEAAAELERYQSRRYS